MTRKEAADYLRPIMESATLPRYQAALRLAVEALEATVGPPPNDPLGLEELREMDGEPVWIVEHPDWGHWELSADAEDYVQDRREEFYGMKHGPGWEIWAASAGVAGLPPQAGGERIMPLLNYTTKVDVYTTLGAIQGQLVKHGAKKIMQDYDDDGHITSLSFMVDTPAGPRGIRLPANVDAVHTVLIRQKVKCDWAQAERVAWRILKDWVEAQMAILESEMVQMDEIFLPYIVGNGGQTFFQAYRENQLTLPGSAV